MNSKVSLKDRILTDMKSAMKNKNSLKLMALKLVYADCRNKEIELKKDLDDAQMTVILKKQIKQYEEMIEQYKKGGYSDSVSQQEERLKFIKAYLPKTLSVEELKAVIEEVISELKPSSMKEMGSVIKTVQSRTAGAVDNRQLAELTKERLQGL